LKLCHLATLVVTVATVPGREAGGGAATLVGVGAAFEILEAAGRAIIGFGAVPLEPPTSIRPPLKLEGKKAFYFFVALVTAPPPPTQKVDIMGEPLWLSGEVEKNEKINEIERTRVCSPPRATSLKKDGTYSVTLTHNLLLLHSKI
jgi:hypothetical protein